MPEIIQDQRVFFRSNAGMHQIDLYIIQQSPNPVSAVNAVGFATGYKAGAQAEPARPFPEEGPESWRQDEPQAYPGRELLELAEEVRDGCYAAGLAVDGND